MLLNRYGFSVSFAVLLSAVAIAAPPRYTAQKLPLPLGAVRNYAIGINRLNDIVGESARQGRPTRATAWTKRGAGTLSTLRAYPASAQALNDTGDIVGYTTSVSGGHYKAFLVRNGNLTILPGFAANPIETIAFGLNKFGVVCGSATTSPTDAGSQHAVYWDAQGIHDIGAVAGSIRSYAFAIDSKGRIAGTSTLSATNQDAAFIWSRGRMKLLFRTRVVSSAAAINNLGHVTGRFYSPNGWRAYFYDGTSPIDLGTIGGDYAWGGDINASDDIVGGCTVANGDLHAFIWTGGTMYDLNSLLDTTIPFPLWHARGINDQGFIVADDENGNSYLLTPVK